MIEHVGAIFFFVACAVTALLWRRCRNSAGALTRQCSELSRAREALTALLDTSPIAALRFVAGQADADVCADYAAFLARLVPADAARLETARGTLLREAAGFSAAVGTVDGREFIVEGRCSACGERILWLLEGGASTVRGERDAALAREAALREMIDAIPLPVWRRDDGGAIVGGNRAFFSVLGGTVGALPLAGSAPPAPAEGRQVEGHIVVDGSRRLFSFTELPRGGGIAVGFALDRTEIESAQSELWRHVNAQAEVLDCIHAGVAIYGPDRRLKYFNTAFAALWGMGEAWLGGEPQLEEILEWLRQRRRIPEHTDFRAYKREHLAMFTQLIEARQDMMHLPDGRTLHLSITPHPLGGLIFLYEDVTDYLALECSLNTLAQVQRATLDHLFEGIAVFGADGRLKLYNPAYRTIWELSEEDVTGEPHVSQIVEKTRGLLDDGGNWTAMRQSIIDGIAAQVPTSGLISRCDGSLLQAAMVPLPDGEVLLTYLDVSDSARVEQALREKNEALETADRLKSEFIANVSYELRTPLNAVIGFTELLDHQYFGPLNERQLEYTRHILDSARQLATLIGDVLDLATIEAGYMRLEPGPVDVTRLLQAVAGLAEELARSRELHLLLDCAAEVGCIEADERRLKQAMFNLVSSAIRYTPPGGTIRIEAALRDGDMMLAVADGGIGVELGDHDDMLAASERRMGRSGAGLGLSLVKKLIELHGGTVGIESAAGHGTRVVCRLPIGRRCRRRGARPGGDLASNKTNVAQRARRASPKPGAAAAQGPSRASSRDKAPAKTPTSGTTIRERPGVDG